jgi:hypothetical protein
MSVQNWKMLLSNQTMRQLLASDLTRTRVSHMFLFESVLSIMMDYAFAYIYKEKNTVDFYDDGKT